MAGEVSDLSLDRLLMEMVGEGASDLHIQVGIAPSTRLHGELKATAYPPLTPDDAEAVFREIASEKQIKELDEVGAVDFAHEIAGVSRFRVNAFKQRGTVAMALRSIPDVPESFEDLRLPETLEEISDEERGIILMTGATGSGKSTTLAVMMNRINETRSCRIITIEDPVEYMHTNKKSIIAQRELGPDARTFDEALRHVLRQDPDVVLIGELRDLETIRAAIRAAETGHLIFSTLHTASAAQAVDRMMSYYPPEQHELVRKQLALNLKAVVSQRLLRRKDGSGRIPAVEILRSSPIVQKLLLAGKTKEISQVIQNREVGMRTFDQSLVELVNADLVSQAEAERLASNPNALRRILSGGYSDADRSSILQF